MKQQDFFESGSTYRPNDSFGGGKSHSTHPKTKRSFSRKNAIHITMRSEFAVGGRSMLSTAHRDRVDRIVRDFAAKFQLKLYRFVNVGNHLHIVVKAPSRLSLSRFLRTISALIARLVMKAERGSPMTVEDRFWQARPFSKIISWGRQFRYLVQVYMAKNRLEAVGFTTPAARFYAGVIQD